MEIRQIKKSELPELLTLYRHLHPADDPLPEPASVEAIWEELNSNPRYRYIGAYADGKLVASCTISIIPNLTRGCKPYGIIENVVTHANHRGQGHGKAVLAAARSYAWQQNCYKVMLLTSRKTEEIYRFYAAAGFDGQEKQAFVARPGKHG